MNTEIETSTKAIACGREVWAADEIPFAVALEVVKLADLESRISTVKELLASLYRELRPLNPIENGNGKYINIEAGVHGYEHQHLDFSVYFGEDLHIKDATAVIISEAIKQFDPVEVRKQKAVRLRAELAKLEGEEIPNNQAA